MIPKDDRIKFAGLMIKEGKIDSVDTLYQYLTKKAVAEILGVNINRFSNIKSHHPGEFKINELKKLSAALDVELSQMVTIINNSILQTT